MSGDSLKHAHVHPEFALSVELVHPRSVVDDHHEKWSTL
jgi:hypothetical protein